MRDALIAARVLGIDASAVLSVPVVSSEPDFTTLRKTFDKQWARLRGFDDRGEVRTNFERADLVALTAAAVPVVGRVLRDLMTHDHTWNSFAHDVMIDVFEGKIESGQIFPTKFTEALLGSGAISFAIPQKVCLVRLLWDTLMNMSVARGR